MKLRLYLGPENQKNSNLEEIEEKIDIKMEIENSDDQESVLSDDNKMNRYYNESNVKCNNCFTRGHFRRDCT